MATDSPTKIIHLPVLELAAAINEASTRHQLVDVTWHVLKDEVWGTAMLVDKRELAAAASALSLAGNGRPPFGR